MNYSLADSRSILGTKIVLASQSPRRLSLLKDVGFIVTVHPSTFEETPQPHMSSDELVIFNSKEKAQNVASSIQSGLILGADTIVIHPTLGILEKPHDTEDAHRMLNALSNTTHHVKTGVTIINAETHAVDTYVETTTVTFAQLSNTDISTYIASCKPYDLAGAYGIQNVPKGFIKSIDGSISNVIGLPIEKVVQYVRNGYFTRDANST